MNNYYEILGVSKDASQEDIKKAYRKLSLEFHPDRNPNGEDKFKEISSAYNVVGDKDKRKEYDAQLNNPFGRMGGRQFHESNIDDLFSQMFGGRPGQQQRGSVPDKVIEVQVNTLESYNGVSKTITYNKKTYCEPCNGKGGERSACLTCGGQGFVTQRAGTCMFTQIIKTSCGQCSGQGFTINNPCYSCNGKGTKEMIDNLQITLPKNIDNGQHLRVPNKGDFYNGMVGNLILKINLIPQNGFEKINNDLVYNAYFNLDDLKKDSFDVPHPDGKIEVKFPTEFNTQVPLRIKSKGFKSNQIGDMFIKMNVKYSRG